MELNVEVRQEDLLRQGSKGVSQWCHTWGVCQEFEYRWTISDFGSFSSRQSDPLRSSLFFSGEEQRSIWRLILYPNGRDEGSRDGVSVCILLLHSHLVEVKFNYIMTVLGRGQEPLIERSQSAALTCGQQSWIDNLITWKEILESKDRYLPGNILTLQLKAVLKGNERKTVMPIETFNSFLPKEHSQNYYRLLLDDKLTDVVITVGDSVFRAHKVILAGGSPFFEAMFMSDMVEARSSHVKLKDISSEVFRQILKYMYTGECVISNAHVKSILLAAEMYQIENLKLSCEFFISEKLELDNLVEALLLAERANASHLKAATIKVCASRILELLKIPKWTDLCDARPKTAVKALESVIECIFTSSVAL